MKKLIVAILIIALFAGLGFFAYQKFMAPTDAGTMGPVKNNLETELGDPATANWKTYSNAKYSFEVKYPADFFDENQQPRIFAGDCNYQVFPSQCPNINNLVMNDMVSQGADLNIVKNNFTDTHYWDNPAGTRQTVGGVQYCLYSTGDAGAGHSFNSYYFTTVKSNKCMVLYLTTSMENCDNYLPLESGNIEQSQNYNNCLVKNENQPTTLDKIISTFKFTK